MGMKAILGTFVLTTLAYPGVISIGVKGGVPLNDAFNAASSGSIRYLANTKRYTIGPELDVNLPLGLAIEFNALYRRLDFDSTGNGVDVVVRQATKANAWDFPVLLKWRFAPGPIRPYVSAGPTFRNLSNIEQVQNFFVLPGNVQTTSTTSQPAELQNRFTTGFTVGGGVQLGGRVRFSPEIRYTRWGWETFRSVNSLLKSNPDQVQFLVGLTF